MTRAALLSAALSAGLLLPAAPGAADGQERVPPPGSWGLSFHFPEGGGGGFGVRRMVTPGINAGLAVDLGLSWSDAPDVIGEGDRTRWQVGLRPDVRLYRPGTGPVVPFVALGAGAAYGSGPEDAWRLGLSGRAGLGVEWFPLRSASLAGSTGVRAGYTRSTAREGSRASFNVSLFRSELTLNFYF